MSGLPGVQDAHQGTDTAHQPTGVVGDGGAALDAGTTGLSGDAHNAGLGLDGGVKGGVAGKRPLLAVTRDAGIDDFGVDGLQQFVGNAELLHGAGLEVLDHGVGCLDQLQEEIPLGRILHVEEDGALAPVPGGVVAAVVIPDDVAVAGVVPHGRILNFDDLRAVVAQQQGTHGARHKLGEIQNSNAFQWFHCDFPPNGCRCQSLTASEPESRPCGAWPAGRRRTPGCRRWPSPRAPF